MGQLIPIQLDDGTIIHIEATETNLELPKTHDPDNPPRSIFPADPAQKLAQNIQALESTIRAYTTYSLKAFKNLAIAEVSEVELKFGVSVDVRTGIPYIADGKAGCNLEVSVKCIFPSQKPEK